MIKKPYHCPYGVCIQFYSTLIIMNTSLEGHGLDQTDPLVPNNYTSIYSLGCLRYKVVFISKDV